MPEIVKATMLGCERKSRAQLLSGLFNAASVSLGVAGTSGKSTTTGMLGWILARRKMRPTIMNGAVMKNFVSPEAPFASAVVGGGGMFVSEIDESDGSIELYNPDVAVLLNVSLDHKSLDELRGLFTRFIAKAKTAVINFDNDEARLLAPRAKSVTSYGIEHPRADIGIEPGTIVEEADGIAALLVDRREDVGHPLQLKMPGRHNLSNALAAIGAAVAAGVDIGDAVVAIESFAGLARRFDIIGTSEHGMTVIDDFGHNPEKCRATLRTLKAQPGRVIAFFQPHGYGPLRQMGHELAETFAKELGPEDHTLLCDPVYFGGTVDRSEGSERIVRLIEEAGGSAEYYPTREECRTRIWALARPGDRIVVMGARDDTLTTFAQKLLQGL